MSHTRLLIGISVFWVALSMFSDGVTTLLLPAVLLGRIDDGSKATVLGLLTFAGLIAGMLVQPVAGVWSDRLRSFWGRRGTLGAGTLLLVGALALFLAPGLLFIAVGYLVAQVAAGIAQASQQGFLPDLVPQESRGLAAGLKGAADIGGGMIGFVVLGQLMGGGTLAPALLAIGGALILAFLLTVFLVREPRQRAHTTVDPIPRPADTFRVDLRRHRTFAWLVVSRFLFLLGTFAVGRFLLYFVADTLALDAATASEQAGTLLPGLGLVTVIASLPAGWASDRFGRRPLMIAGATLGALGALLMIWAATAVQILIFGSLMSLGTATFVGANWALTADVVPKERAAHFFGLANVGTAGATAAAGLFGPLVDWANAAHPGGGYTVLFSLAAFAFVVSGAVLGAVRLPAASDQSIQEV